MAYCKLTGKNKTANPSTTNRRYVLPLEHCEKMVESSKTEERRVHNEVEEKFKENDEKVRREKLKKAEHLMEKNKPGGRILKTAALQSEVLRERNLQIGIKNEFEKIMNMQQERVTKACVSKSNPWIPDSESQKLEKMEKIKNSKREMFKTIEQTAKQKASDKKRLLLEQCAKRALIDNEIRCQIEKERMTMEKKRVLLRQNAIEAMKMAEERKRRRDHRMDEIEDRLNSVYNNGKAQLDKIVKTNEQQNIELKMKMIEMNTKNLIINDNKQSVEEERVRQDISRMKLKFTEAELEKKEKQKAAKQARIESHLKNVEERKLRRCNLCEQQRFDTAQRYKNDEINKAFFKSQSEDKRREWEQFRVILKEQLAEKETKKIEEKELPADDPYVEQYKNYNQIDCVKTLPKHLVSKILIGCRQAEDNKQTETRNLDTNKEKVLQECIKTTELLHSSWRSERNRPDSFKYGLPANCNDIEFKKNNEIDACQTCDKKKINGSNV